MSYSHIAGGMVICSLLLGSHVALAHAGGAAGITVNKAVPANAVGVAPANAVGAIPAKNIQQLDKKLQTGAEQK